MGCGQTKCLGCGVSKKGCAFKKGYCPSCQVKLKIK